MLYQQGGRIEQAESLYRQALSLYPNHILILLKIGELLLRAGKTAEALPFLEKARQSEPSNQALVLLLAECFLGLERPKEAIKLLTEAIRQGLKHPGADELLKKARGKLPKKGKHPMSLQAEVESLAKLLQSGEFSETAARARTLLKLHPHSLQTWRYLGMAYLALKKYDAAIEPLKKSLDLQFGLAVTHFNLGFALRHCGRLDESLAAYGESIRLKPEMVEAHNNLGNLLLVLKRPNEALTAFQRAWELKPGVAEIQLNLGEALRDMGNLKEAEEAYRNALRIKPDMAEAYSSLGFVLASGKRHEEALEACLKSITLNPDNPRYHNNLGITLRKLNRPAEAANSFRFALDKLPEDTSIYRNYAHALADMGNLSGAKMALQQALEIQPDDIETRSSLIFTLNYMNEVSPEQVLIEARRFDCSLNKRASPFSDFSNSPEPNRRLRVGLVSGDFGEHSVGYFLMAVLANLDPQQIELYAYETMERTDSVNTLLRSIVPNWREAMAKRLSDNAFADMIRADRIDILVDLAGHTAHNRLPVFARKPAPVQVGWLGYLGTTGLAAMDYILADPWALPVCESEHFVERVWHMPETYLCFTPPDIVVEEGPLPALANGFVTFGCFNNLIKIGDRVIACWSEILKAVDGSRLFIKSKQLSTAETCHEVERRFGQHGIPPDRLILEGQTVTREAHLSAYQRMDICLDPYPYPGITSTLEALWMGVPVLTMQGDRFLGHQGETIMHNLGLPEWIAEDEEAYQAKAVAVASDVSALADLRECLRDKLLTSPICDAPRFARNFEAALLGMWRKWSAHQESRAN